MRGKLIFKNPCDFMEGKGDFESAKLKCKYFYKLVYKNMLE